MIDALRFSRFEWFIARRYIFSRERKLLVSAITLISVAGVALGVGALIIVLGVMDGADKLIFGKIADLSPHVRVRRTDNAPFTPDPALLARLRDDPRVAKAEPLLNRLTYVQVPGSDTQGEVVQLIGQNQVGPGQLFNIPNRATQRAISIGDGELLLGGPVAGALGLAQPPFGEVRLASTELIQTALGPQSKILNVAMLGYYWTGFSELDAVTAFVSESTIRELYRLPAGYDYIHIRLRDPWRAEAFARELQLPAGYLLTTWAEENSKFFSALKLEKFGMFITMLLVVLVAAFNIVGTLILMALEKTREVGILRAMGASPAMISRIFMLDGMLIGVVGTVLGTLFGLVGGWLIPQWRIPLQSVVFLDHIPVDLRAGTILSILGTAFVICALAAIYPARQAARLNPIEALKFE